MMAAYYRNLLLKQWWIIAICALGLGLGAFATSHFTPAPAPKYASSALVYVNGYSGFDYAGYLITQAQLATSTKVLSAVAANNAGLSVDQLRGEISGTALAGTHLLQITAKDGNAARAAKLANDAANALISQEQQYQQLSDQQAIQQIQDQISSTQQHINQASSDLTSAIQSGNQSQIASLQAQLNGLQEQQALLQWSLAQAQLAQSDNTITMVLTEQAQASASPVKQAISRPVLFLGAGLLLGAIIGLALSIGLDLLARRRVQGKPSTAATPAQSLPTQSAQ